MRFAIKVFIITEGGKNIGFGHITRCISLCQAFEERGVKPEFIINGDESVEGALKGRKHRIFNWIERKERLFNLIKGAHIVILDSYLVDYGFYKRLSETAEIPIYIDDNDRFDYPAGIIINSCIDGKSGNYPNEGERVYLRGVKYAPLRSDFWHVPPKRIKKNIENIMITFGGDDKRGMTSVILKLLKEKYSRLRKNAVISKGFKAIESTKKNADNRVNVIFDPDAQRMREVMMESDIAISAGGQTLYELARTGVPTIGICVAENQKRNLRGWEDTGFLEYAGWYDDKNLKERLAHCLKRLQDMEFRKNKYKIAKEIIDGKGSLRIVAILLSRWCMNNLSVRRACLEDAADIFNLFNEDVVRNASLNPEKIEWAHHLNWLKQKLESQNCVFFIIYHAGKFYGQVRFDIIPAEKKAIINISLVREIRGLKLASFFLDKAVEEFLKTHNEIERIVACIKAENLASLRSFEKAGFTFSKNEMINGKKTSLYVREIDHAKV